MRLLLVLGMVCTVVTFAGGTYYRPKPRCKQYHPCATYVKVDPYGKKQYGYFAKYVCHDGSAGDKYCPSDYFYRKCNWDRHHKEYREDFKHELCISARLILPIEPPPAPRKSCKKRRKSGSSSRSGSSSSSKSRSSRSAKSSTGSSSGKSSTSGTSGSSSCSSGSNSSGSSASSHSSGSDSD